MNTYFENMNTQELRELAIGLEDAIKHCTREDSKHLLRSLHDHVQTLRLIQYFNPPMLVDKVEEE